MNYYLFHNTSCLGDTYSFKRLKHPQKGTTKAKGPVKLMQLAYVVLQMAVKEFFATHF